MQESKNDQNYLIANSKNVEKLIYHNKNQIKSNWIESREKKCMQNILKPHTQTQKY